MRYFMCLQVEIIKGQFAMFIIRFVTRTPKVLLLYSPSATRADNTAIMTPVRVNALWRHAGRIHYRGIGQAAACYPVTDDSNQADIDDAGINENGETTPVNIRRVTKLLRISTRLDFLPSRMF
jgi:hypothetical protein